MTTQAQDTPALPQNYLQMPYSQFVWLRREFMALCEDFLEAMIMRAIEYEIEGDRRAWLRHAAEVIEQGKEAPQEPEWWITLSHKQIISRLYEASRSEKTIITKLRSLVNKRFLLMRDNPNNRYGSPQYTINKDVVQGKLDELPSLPGMRESAKSQATLPPSLTPPPNNDLPPKYTGGETPKMGGLIRRKRRTFKKEKKEKSNRISNPTILLSLSLQKMMRNDLQRS
jgi:hypothetical protein